MLDQGLVSVIIPMRNAAPFVGACLSSVVRQTYQSLEILVVDDGSTDDSAAVVGSCADGRIMLLKGLGNGACSARNIGLARSRGEWVQFLDADDILGEDKIRHQLEMLGGVGGPAVASCRWRHFSQVPGDLKRSAEPDWSGGSGIEFLIRSLSGSGMFQTACWLTPRTLIERAGLWNESLGLHDDGEFFARVLAAAPVVLVDVNVGVHYRKVPESLSGRRDSGAARSSLMVSKIRGDTVLAAEDSPRTRAAVATSFLQVAYEFQFRAPDVSSEALDCLIALGADPHPRVGGIVFRKLIRLMGPAAALRLRKICLNISTRIRGEAG